MPTDNTLFGELLRGHRRAAGLSQQGLAERAGLSPDAVRALERGRSQAPRPETLARLAAALELGAQARAALGAVAWRAATRSAGEAPPAPGSPPDGTAGSPLVGRGRELALLGRHLAGAGPPLLLLAGEPGIGKTRLLQAAVQPGASAGWRVLAGGCQRRGGHEPYAPLLDALRGHLGALAPVQLRAALVGCAWLVRLLPELAGGPIEPLPAWELPPEQERRLMVAAVRRLLSNIAGTAGTLLLLDDLQWAGADALDLLAALIRAVPEVPVRVVGAYRDTEVRPADPLSILLADLAHAGLAAHHTLGPLAPTEAAHLLAELLAGIADSDEGLEQRVVQRAGGVPFFLVSYARGLQDGAGESVPWDLAQGLRQRVAMMPLGAREVLGVAAVIGRSVERTLLAAAADRPDDDLLAALDAACTGQLLREADDETYQFVHDVIREVVEADLGAARRAVLHRRVAEALEGLPGPSWVERLAYHYTQGEVWMKALDYLVRAGDRAAGSYANGDALEFYALALAVCERLGDAALPTVVAVAMKRGGVHMLVQRPGEAIGDYARMAEAARRLGDRRLEGLALANRGAAEEEHHEFETAEATLRAALAIGEEGHDDVLSMVAHFLPHTITMVGRKAEGEALLREIGARARLRGDAGTSAASDDLLGLLYVWDGRYDEAQAAWARSASCKVEPPEDRMAAAGSAWAMALLEGARGAYQRALAILHDTLPVCERAGEVWVRRRVLNTLGWLHGELQDHRRAMEWNTRGVEAARERIAPETTPECENNARINLGDALLALGRLEEAEQQFLVVERIVRAPQPQDRYMLWRYAQHLFHSLGELWLARSDVARAMAYADECLALAEATGSGKNIVKGRRLRGQALLLQGRLPEAGREFDAALRTAERVGNPYQLWCTHAALGDLHRAEGRAEEASGAYGAALVVIKRVAAGLRDAALRETFLTSAHVRRIRGHAGMRERHAARPPSQG